MQLRSILVALALGASSAFMRPASVSRVTARFSVEDKLKEIEDAVALFSRTKVFVKVEDYNY